MARTDAPTLRALISIGKRPLSFFDRAGAVRFTDLDKATSFNGRLGELAGRSLLLACGNQLTSALALIELDGVARRIVILPPDLASDHLAAIVATAEIDAAVIDGDTRASPALESLLRVTCAPDLRPAAALPPGRLETEWVLLTSGTTGVPKMVVHTLQTLTAALKVPTPADGADVWGTFYDIRRFGGLQIYLRALAGGASLVLSSAGEVVDEHLARLAAHGVTHLSGTPTQWRRALMAPTFQSIAPRYARLSGEIADQAILDSLRAAFPRATVGHAYASTEVGVAFDVNDGRTGFPADAIGHAVGGVAMKILDGSLRVRSPGAALRYVDGQPLADASGFIDTGDIVERHGERLYFAGRKGGIINVGGLKVHPEEIEAVINRHPSVRASLVRPRQNPITGAVVVADVVLNQAEQGAAAQRAQAMALKDDILKLCRERLPVHKVPAAISFVPALDVAATGKLLRRPG